MGGISFFKYYSFFHSSSLVFVLSQSITPFFYLRPSLPFVPSFSSVVFVLARLPSLLFIFQYHRSSCILFTSLFFLGGGALFHFTISLLFFIFLSFGWPHFYSAFFPPFQLSFVVDYFHFTSHLAFFFCSTSIIFIVVLF